MNVPDDELIRLWHLPESANDIARSLGVTDHVLAAQWRRLKMLGLLPHGSRRGASNKRVFGPDPASFAGDGRPSDGGGMLDALRREHGPNGRTDYWYDQKRKRTP